MMEVKKLKVVVKEERHQSNGKVRIQRPISAIKKPDLVKDLTPIRHNIKKHNQYLFNNFRSELFPSINEPKRVQSASKTPKIKATFKKLDLNGTEPLPALNERDKFFAENLALRTEIKKLKVELTHYKAEANRAISDLDKREKQIQDFVEKDKPNDNKNNNVSFTVNVTNSPDVASKLREVLIF
jgi:hypothetical protein